MRASKPPQKPRKLSGAQFRRQRAERAASAEREEVERLQLATEQAHALASIQPPPEDAVQRVAWANQQAAHVLHQVMTDPVIDSERRWKLALEAVRSLGMTSVKAIYESRLRAIEEKIYGKPPSFDDGLEDISDYEDLDRGDSK